MADPLSQAGASLFGESQFPSQRSLFTPAAFGRAMDIRQRASLAKGSAAGAMGMLESVSRIGDFERQTRDLSEDTESIREQARIFRQREQDETLRRYEENARERELQPQYREMIQRIDPYDPAAPEQYAALYPKIGQVDAKTQSDIAIRMAAAQRFREDRDSFYRAARGAGFSEQDIAEKSMELDKAARTNPDAYRAFIATMPSFNQLEAQQAEVRATARNRQEAVEKAILSGVDPKKPPSDTRALISTSLTALKSKLPALDVEKFLENPVTEKNRLLAVEAEKEANASKNFTKYRNKAPIDLPLTQKELDELTKPFVDQVLGLKLLESNPSPETVEATRRMLGVGEKSGTPGVAPAPVSGTFDIKKLGQAGRALREKGQ